MQIKSTEAATKSKFVDNKEIGYPKKVDINILLNRVKTEKKGELKKNLIITLSALATLAITGLISVI